MVPTDEKKSLWLVLLYLATISLPTRTKLKKFIKGILNYCNLQFTFESQNELFNNYFKDPVPQILKFQGGLCNESYYGECSSHPAVRSGEHIGISHLTNKSVQPRKNSAVYYD